MLEYEAKRQALGLFQRVRVGNDRRGKLIALRGLGNRQTAGYGQQHAVGEVGAAFKDRGVEQRVVRHKVDVTVSQRLLQRRRVHLLHVDSHVRKQRRKRGDQRGKHVGRLQRRAAQRQRAGQAVFGVADVLAQIFFQIEHLRCGVHIGAADVGQRYGRGAAVEDRRAQPFLRLANHLAEGRLRNKQRRGRAGKALVPVNGEHIAHLMKHRITS